MSEDTPSGYHPLKASGTFTPDVIEDIQVKADLGAIASGGSGRSGSGGGQRLTI